jgi:hypothetical protein
VAAAAAVVAVAAAVVVLATWPMLRFDTGVALGNLRGLAALLLLPLLLFFL